MLNALRKKKVAKRILWVLAILVIPAFVLWGTSSLGKKTVRGFTYVGIVRGKKIGIDDFFGAKRGMEIQILLNYFGQKDMLDAILKDRALVNKLTWDRIVMVKEAERLGIKVKDDEVIGFITSHPLFLSRGVFDKKFYNYMLEKNLGINARTFEEEIRNALKIAKLKDDILEDTSVGDGEVSEAYKNEYETGRVSYIRIERESLKDKVNISNKEIEDYYEEFKSDFMVPEKINLEYLEFPYRTPEEKQYLIANIKVLIKRLKKEDFASIAKEGNRIAEETGLFSPDSPPAKFNLDRTKSDSLFNLEENDIRVLMEDSTEGSAYLVRIKEKVPAKFMTKDEAGPSITALLTDKKTEVLAGEEADKVYDYLEKEGAPLESAASNFNLTVNKTELISRFGYIEGVGEARQVLDVLFKDTLGAARKFTTRKGYIIARLDEFKEIDKDKFDKEKNLYKNKVLAQKKNQVLGNWLAKISENASLAIDLNLL